MATRTWIGTTNDNPTVTSNWLEGVVPVAGDDVVFNSTYSNPCTLVADFPATGQFRSLTMVGYTGTLNFGNYKMYVGQGNYNGTILDAGTTANFTCGSGGIELYSNTTTSSNYNVIKCNNSNLRNVNFFLRNSGLGRYIDAQTDWYCKNLTIINYSTYLSNRSYNIYIYGNITSLAGINNSNVDLNIFAMSLYLRGNGVLDFSNFIQVHASVYVEGNYTLNKNASFLINNTTNNSAGVYFNGGTINCNSYDLILLITGLFYPHYIDINQPIDNLIIHSSTFYLSTVVINHKLIVNNKFQLIERPASRVPYLIVKSNTTGTKVDIELGNNCKYLIYGHQLQDLRFNIPVKAFYSQITNCENITNGEYPNVNISVF